MDGTTVTRTPAIGERRRPPLTPDSFNDFGRSWGMMKGVLDHDIPWASLFEISSIPMSVIDAHGRQVASNQAYAEFLGYSIAEMADVDVGRITRPEDHDWTRSYLMRLVSGEIDRFETDKWYVRKDGSMTLARLSTRSMMNDDGDCEYLIATLVPVEARQRNVDESVAQRLLEYTGDTVTLFDTAGVVKFTKGQLTRVAGYPTPYWTDRSVREFLQPGELERLIADNAQFLATPGAVVESEIELRHADGSPHLSALRAINCTDDPVLAGYVVVTRDITAEREAVNELARRGATAEAVADAQTRLLATVSHELRNPLHAVRGIAELLAAEELPARAADLASSLVRQLSGLAHVTQDLLDAARLDAGKVTFDPTATDLETLVDDVTALGRAAAGNKPLNISHRVARGVPDWVLADTDRLRQILSNLVGNAVKFTETGSVQLIVRADAEGNTVFSVVDTGAGIPPEEHASVLQPFTVGSTAGESRGAGLGLSIVQRLVSAMGGRISLSSAVGEGTRFDVVLPLERCDPPASRKATAIPDGVKVLVVEDNPVNQQLARSQLERLGIEAVIVDRGEDGYRLLTEASPSDFQAVLMDQQLPGWSGTETTRRLREHGGHLAELPIIGLSASASSNDRDGFIDAGMTDFVAKPASIDDLARAIGDAIARRHEPSAARFVPAAEPPAPTEALTTTVDGDVLIRLGQELGSDDIVAELVRTFLDELDTRVDAIVGQDVAESRRGAHTLKSSARLLGANALADLCAAIEKGERPSDGVAELAAQTGDAMGAWLTTQDS